MPRYLFSSAVLPILCVLLICCSSGAAADGKKDVVDPFQGTTKMAGVEWKEAAGGVTSFRAPSLVEVDGEVFAIAGAQVKDDCKSGCFTGIASKQLKKVAGVTAVALAMDASPFYTQVLKGGETDAVEINDTVRPTTLVSGKNIYMLLGKYDRKASAASVPNAKHRGLFLVRGNVSEDGGTRKIQWYTPHAVNTGSMGLRQSWTQLSGGGGTGIVMEDGTLVFPMQATNENGEDVLLSMRLEPSKDKWEVSLRTKEAHCKEPSIVEWGGDQKLLMMTPCKDGYYDVYRAFGAGTSLYPVGEPISRVWGTSLKRQGEGARSGFITATIDGMKVMLLTTPVYSEEKGKGRLHLWVTDNARVHDVGPVSSETDDAAASSLLYRAEKKELILLYENKKSGDSYSLVAMNLTEQLERIKSVVKAWKDMDAALKSCASTGTVDPRIKNVCKGAVPTKGLAGFWSNSLKGNLWKDEYLGVDATVHGGNVAGTEGVVRFRGAGAGAEWPVGKLGQNQPYYFANNEFTLVATVMINAVPEAEGPVPLMGVRMNDNASTVLLGLSYTKDKKWVVTVNGKPRALSEEDGTWQPGTTHQVALQMDWNEVYVYVDGNNIYGGDEDEEDTVSDELGALFESRRISHFYLGGGVTAKGTATSHDMTVASVLLYTEAVGRDEMASLKASKATLAELAAGKDTEKEVASVPTGVGVHTGGPSEKDSTDNNLVHGGHSPTDPGAGSASLPAKEQPAASPPSSAPNPSVKEKGEPLQGKEHAPAGQKDAAQTTPQRPSAVAPEAHHGGDAAGGSHANQTLNGAGEGEKKKGEEPRGNGTSGPPLAPASPSADVNSPAAPGKHEPAAAAPLSGNSSANLSNTTGAKPNGGKSDGTVRGCVPRLLLIALLGLCGATVLY
ncbi:trans-sialidase [Trypanosoma rangeli]|uniref:Trans-sialidase n=1 Tax=Trypanosoma rangeli TaxID=5698 RepID=A0A422MT64_TRYRA|nr:trans-sialidase [Trypanosoma rangeli]RNE96391.1 trans-sialidase [Trypanosoma rangeli]|eukprot:RNE96391.1 trans-sialidase [Trypanosoma rangeli]